MAIFNTRYHTEEKPMAFKWWSPHMTSNNSPDPYYTTSSTAYKENNIVREPWYAFDGSFSTFWYGGPEPSSTITFDFGENALVAGIRMSIRNGLPIGFPKTGDIEGSDDGEMWHSIASFQDEQAPDDGNFREHMFGSKNYRYYRLTNLISNYSGYVTISEIEFYKV